jgi:tryptophanyl-tRNA synthetase
MSKSASSEYNYIALSDSPDKITQKIKKAVTDSGSEIKSGEDKPALTNLLSIMSEVTGKTIPELEKQFEGKGYGDFKSALAESLVDYLTPIQEKYNNYMSDETELKKILTQGAEKIAPIAQKTIDDVKSKIGLINL